MKVLLEKKGDTHARCGAGNTALHVAARGGHADAVKFLVAKIKVKEGHQGPAAAKNQGGMTPLICCSMNGHYEAAKALIDARADVDTADAQGMTPSIWSVRHGHCDMLTLLLEEGFDLNQQDNAGYTVMDHAVEHLEMRTALVAQGSLNQRLLDGMQRNDSYEVQEALRLSAHVNARDSVGFTPLSWGIVNNATALVKLLAQRNANPNHSDLSSLDLGDESGEMMTALQWGLDAGKRLMRAAKMDDWEQVMIELDAGANVNQKEDDTLLTCAMCAAIYGEVDQVWALAGRKANLNQRDCVGWTTAHFAAYSGNCETVSSLLELKCDFTAKTYEQQSMLHLAARADDGAMVQMLLVAKAKPNAKDAEHDTPLQVAAKWGSSEAFTTLLRYDADPSVRDSNSHTLMMLASIHGHLAIVESLFVSLPELPPIDAPEGMTNENKDCGRYKLIKDARQKREKVMKANPASFNGTTLLNEQDDHGRYPVHLAVIYDWEHICTTMLRQGARVDVFDHNKDTALMMASHIGSQPIVELLLQYNPFLNQKNKDEKTAVDFATKREIRRLLHKFAIEGSLPPQEAQSEKRHSKQREPVYRVRAEGFSKVLMPDVLEQQVMVLLKTLKCPKPAKTQVVTDPISGRPLGYANLDFSEGEHAISVVQNRSVQLRDANPASGFTTVRLIMEGPRAKDYDRLRD